MIDLGFCEVPALILAAGAAEDGAGRPVRRQVQVRDDGGEDQQ